jgi:hypothetical protein
MIRNPSSAMRNNFFFWAIGSPSGNAQTIPFNEYGSPKQLLVDEFL